jgi:hypothetical protein
MNAPAPLMDQLLAEARYHRERYDLYKAKAYGARPTSPARLRELERACAFAEARLRQAQSGERRVAASEASDVPAAMR